MIALDKLATSAFPAAISWDAFMTSPISFMLGRCPRFSATSAILVSANSASVGDESKYSSMIRALACSFTASSPWSFLCNSPGLRDSLASTLTTSSSESYLACLPDSSSFWIAASNIRRVVIRNLSGFFIAPVKSTRSRDLNSVIPRRYASDNVRD